MPAGDVCCSAPDERGTNVFWLICAGVVVALFALAWWSSGRAKPGGIAHHQASRDELYQVMRDNRPEGGTGIG